MVYVIALIRGSALMIIAFTGKPYHTKDSVQPKGIDRMDDSTKIFWAGVVTGLSMGICIGMIIFG